MASGRKVNKLPVWITMARSLYGGARALLWSFTGRLTSERVESLIRWWVDGIFAAGDATLRVEGTEHLEPGKSYLFMSNHTSLLDIPALLGAVPGPLRMVAKREVASLPIFGPALRRVDFVFIDRRDSARAIRQLDKAKELLARGVSVWIAPEGTRTRTGKVGPFKKGGFHLARQLSVPIVPTWIEGASDIVAPDSFDVAWGGSVLVRFGRPVSSASEGEDDLVGVMREVRAQLLLLSGRATRDVDGDDASQDVAPSGTTPVRCGKSPPRQAQTQHDVAAM